MPAYEQHSERPLGLVLNTMPLSPCVSCLERAEKEKLETDPMYKLDHGGKDQEKLRKALPSLAEIQDQQESWKDDFQLNSTLRRSFRVLHAHGSLQPSASRPTGS